METRHPASGTRLRAVRVDGLVQYAGELYARGEWAPVTMSAAISDLPGGLGGAYLEWMHWSIEREDQSKSSKYCDRGAGGRTTCIRSDARGGAPVATAARQQSVAASSSSSSSSSSGTTADDGQRAASQGPPPPAIHAYLRQRHAARTGLRPVTVGAHARQLAADALARQLGATPYKISRVVDLVIAGQDCEDVGCVLFQTEVEADSDAAEELACATAAGGAAQRRAARGGAKSAASAAAAAARAPERATLYIELWRLNEVNVYGPRHKDRPFIQRQPEWEAPLLAYLHDSGLAPRVDAEREWGVICQLVPFGVIPSEYFREVDAELEIGFVAARNKAAEAALAASRLPCVLPNVSLTITGIGARGSSDTGHLPARPDGRGRKASYVGPPADASHVPVAGLRRGDNQRAIDDDAGSLADTDTSSVGHEVGSARAVSIATAPVPSIDGDASSKCASGLCLSSPSTVSVLSEAATELASESSAASARSQDRATLPRKLSGGRLGPAKPARCAGILIAPMTLPDSASCTCGAAVSAECDSCVVDSKLRARSPTHARPAAAAAVTDLARARPAGAPGRVSGCAPAAGAGRGGEPRQPRSLMNGAPSTDGDPCGDPWGSTYWWQKNADYVETSAKKAAAALLKERTARFRWAGDSIAAAGARVVVDVGCGDGNAHGYITRAITRAMLPGTGGPAPRFIGIDASPDMVSCLLRGEPPARVALSEAYVGRLANLATVLDGIPDQPAGGGAGGAAVHERLRQGCVDAFLCFDVLHFVKDEAEIRAGLAAMASWLRRDGGMLLVQYFTAEQSASTVGDDEVFKARPAADYQRLFREAGFAHLPDEEEAEAASNGVSCFVLAPPLTLSVSAGGQAVTLNLIGSDSDEGGEVGRAASPNGAAAAAEQAQAGSSAARHSAAADAPGISLPSLLERSGARVLSPAVAPHGDAVVTGLGPSLALPGLGVPDCSLPELLADRDLAPAEAPAAPAVAVPPAACSAGTTVPEPASTGAKRAASSVDAAADDYDDSECEIIEIYDSHDDADPGALPPPKRPRTGGLDEEDSAEGS
jgi:SAM-dependent methyltransferase